MSPFPTFHTDRLILREVTINDVPSYTRHFVDYEVIRFLSAAVPWPFPENGVKDFLDNVVLPKQGNDHWMWGIFLKEHPEELIGAVELWRQDRPENRGFWLGKQFWGKGIMTEANYPIIDHAFKELGFEKLIFANARGNIGSARVKEKTGARKIGTKPTPFVDPQFTESELWELTRSDWEIHRKANPGNYRIEA